MAKGVFFCRCRTCGYILKDSCLNTDDFKINTIIDFPHKKHNIQDDTCRGKLTIFIVADRTAGIFRLENNLKIDDQS